MTTELTTFTPDNPVAILTNGEQFDALLGRIRAEVEAHVPDLTTKKGRDAIKSLAYKVTRTKTALDDAGKELNAGKRKEIDAVDAVRRDVREKLDDLAATARKPLDEWEAKEAERVKTVADAMTLIDELQIVQNDLPSGYIGDKIAVLEGMEFDADIFQDSLEIAINAKASAIEFLTAAKARAEQAEADAAELAELRRKQNERDFADRLADHIRNIGMGMIDGQTYPYPILLNDLEVRILPDIAALPEHADRLEKLRIETIDILKSAMSEQTKRRDEQAAAELAAEKEAAEQKRLADIKAAEQAAADAAKAEAERIAQAEIAKANAEAEALRQADIARQREAERIASETAAREADKAHRGAVMKAAKEAIMSAGDIDENAAKKIVLAIIAGEIPNVRLAF